MRKVKELHACGLYLIRSQSSVNSTYLEDQEEVSLFWNRFNRHLSPYLKVLEHNVGPDGFEFIIRVNDTSKLITEFVRRKRMKYGSFEWDNRPLWKVVSEGFQVFLGQLVRSVNYKRGCKGSRTKRRFERFVFDSMEKLEEYSRLMKEDKIEMKEKKERYCRVEEHCSLDKSDITWLHKWNSLRFRWRIGENWRFRKLSKSIDLQGIKNVLEIELLKTIQLYQFSKPPPLTHYISI